MIIHESFTYGLVNGSVKFVPSSSKTKKMLYTRSLQQLISLSLPENQETKIIERYFPTEQVVSVTKLSHVADGFDRTVTNNKTVLIKIEDYLKACPPKKMVEELL